MLANHRLGLTAAALTTGAGLLSGCASPPPISRFEVPAATRETLSTDASVTLSQLGELQQQLDQFEELRVRGIKRYGFLLLIPSVNTRYERALLHHRELCSAVCERQQQVASGTTRSELVVIGEWALRQQLSLLRLKETIDYVEAWKRVPHGWQPPEGFEYLALSK
jgi:hypothetical protein